MSRPPVSFIAWSPIAGRSEEIAAELGGEARCFWGRPRFGKLSVLLRYLTSAVATAAYLLRRRPRAVIATNPPIVPGLVAYLYGRLFGAPVLLDSHPGGFGLQGDRASRALQPVHAWLAPRVTSTLVTDRELAERVEGWGGAADIVHEAPIEFDGTTAEPVRGGRPAVLFVCIFQRDEPVAEVIEASRRVPEIDVHVTGDLAKCPPSLRESASTNVRFVGFLTGDAYREAVLGADAVLALTTEPSSVVRAGYEAVYAERPLVTSDWPASREVFPHAVHVANDADAIAAGMRRAVAERDALLAAAPRALGLQRKRWEEQLAALRERLAPTETPTPQGT
jgi:glycosyltransferase involved in cell wall biosynthesis